LAYFLSAEQSVETPALHHKPVSVKVTQGKQINQPQMKAVNSGEIALSLTTANNDLNQSPYNSREIPTTVDGSNYSAPIEIPLNIKELAPIQHELSAFNNADHWKKQVVGKGDNLSKIFKRIGLSPQMVYQIITLDNNTQKLKYLRPGEIIHYQLDQNKRLIALKFVIDLQNTLYINRQQPSQSEEQGNTPSQYAFKSKLVNKSIEYRTAYVSGKITDSLYASGKRAGLTDRLVVNLANIFAWDIDFILDIRTDDTFTVLYQEKFLDGEKIGNGQILAAEFVNQGTTFKAVRFTDSNNNTSYYTPQGLNLRKAFLRAPIKFSYISSGFNPRRFHPILKRWKAHRGIDYRAKTGTPIHAAGDGKVIQSSYNRFNGKYVFIQHGQGIVTKYLHMSRRAVSRGKRVKQGQVIGYVGATGLAEAPHLHYEFVVNGVHRNPRTVKLPKADPIAKKEKAQFVIASQKIISQLELRKQIQSNYQVAM